MQQNLARAIRQPFLVALAKQQAAFHFAVGGSDRGDAAVQGVSDIKGFAIRGDLHGEVFQIGVGCAERFQRFRIQLINHPALHIFKAFGTGHVQGIARRRQRHLIQAIRQIASNHVVGRLSRRSDRLGNRRSGVLLRGDATAQRQCHHHGERRNFHLHQEILGHIN
ncbi:hypothetical protein D3C72_1103640 [compost metagenome]